MFYIYNLYTWNHTLSIHQINTCSLCFRSTARWLRMKLRTISQLLTSIKTQQEATLRVNVIENLYSKHVYCTRRCTLNTCTAHERVRTHAISQPPIIMSTQRVYVKKHSGGVRRTSAHPTAVKNWRYELKVHAQRVCAVNIFIQKYT